MDCNYLTNTAKTIQIPAFRQGFLNDPHEASRSRSPNMRSADVGIIPDVKQAAEVEDYVCDSGASVYRDKRLGIRGVGWGLLPECEGSRPFLILHRPFQ
jgi:hypothetical protein